MRASRIVGLPYKDTPATLRRRLVHHAKAEKDQRDQRDRPDRPELIAHDGELAK
jgi:hypothetical protein